MAYAVQNNLGALTYVIGDDDPHRELLDRMGLKSGLRSLHTMALAFDAEALFATCWQGRLNRIGAPISVRTPTQDIELIPAQSPGEDKITLEMKDDTLTRWLMGRIDFRTRVKEGTITIHNGNKSFVEELQRAVPFVPWVYHPLDYC